MEYHDKEYCLEVWGDFACFTRPEMKVERVSYDVMTPSSARAIFSAIFWKPAFNWIVTRIDVLSPIEWISFRRNEVGSVMSPHSPHIFAEDARQQRSALLLRDVRYRIYARLEYIPPRLRPKGAEIKEGENPAKYYESFERRARKGQCFNTPYLGCREFSASWRWIENPEEVTTEQCYNRDREIGFMLYDMDFSDPHNPKAMFYRPVLRNNTIIIPHPNSKEVYR